MSPKILPLNAKPSVDFEYLQTQQSYLQKELDQLKSLIPKYHSMIRELENNLIMLKKTSNAVSLHEYKKIKKEILDKLEMLLKLEVSHAHYEKEIGQIKSITQRQPGILIKGIFGSKSRRTPRKNRSRS